MSRGHVDTVQFLIKCGASLLVQNNIGLTVLHVVIIKVDYLLNPQSNPKLRRLYEGSNVNLEDYYNIIKTLKKDSDLLKIDIPPGYPNVERTVAQLEEKIRSEQSYIRGFKDKIISITSSFSGSKTKGPSSEQPASDSKLKPE